MKKAPLLLALCLLLSCAVALTQASASDPTAGAAKKKCKQPKNKVKGKCKFRPKYGFYNGGQNGGASLRLSRSGSKKIVRLVNSDYQNVTCSDGTKFRLRISGDQSSDLYRATLKGTKFKYDDPEHTASFSGKFTRQKTMKGTYTLHPKRTNGTTCTSAPAPFKVSLLEQ